MNQPRFSPRVNSYAFEVRSIVGIRETRDRIASTALLEIHTNAVKLQFSSGARCPSIDRKPKPK